LAWKERVDSSGNEEPREEEKESFYRARAKTGGGSPKERREEGAKNIPVAPRASRRGSFKGREKSVPVLFKKNGK